MILSLIVLKTVIYFVLLVSNSDAVVDSRVWIIWSIVLVLIWPALRACSQALDLTTDLSSEKDILYFPNSSISLSDRPFRNLLIELIFSWRKLTDASIHIFSAGWCSTYHMQIHKSSIPMTVWIIIDDHFFMLFSIDI